MVAGWSDGMTSSVAGTQGAFNTLNRMILPIRLVPRLGNMRFSQCLVISARTVRREQHVEKLCAVAGELLAKRTAVIEVPGSGGRDQVLLLCMWSMVMMVIRPR
ncbi:hypothetical protein D3C84_710490 [compost metagenome]